MSVLGRSSRHAIASIRPRPGLTSQLLLRQHPGLPSENHRHASRVAARIPFTPPSFPTIDSCPAPTCQCRETPAGLDIEREQSLNGSMAAYAEQVLISTGKPDWASKTEDEGDAVFLRQMKKFLGRNGKYSDPFHNVLLTNSSIQPTPQGHHSAPEPSTQPATSKPASEPTAKPGTDTETVPQDDPSTAPPASAFLLPSFEYVPSIPLDDSSIETFIKAFILPSRLHAQHEVLSRAQKNVLLREPELRKQFAGVRKVDEIVILICGHGGRDDRCGKMGPVLKEEFEDKLERQNIQILREPPAMQAQEMDVTQTSEQEGYRPAARVGLISHIGGHKFAGNVIVYIPDSWTGHPLAGKGVWYGRIEPANVEGVVAKTVIDGKVIVDHFRGGISRGGEMMRL